jgi:hypothetical protein
MATIDMGRKSRNYGVVSETLFSRDSELARRATFQVAPLRSRWLRNGQLVEAAESSTALLPVVVATTSSAACIDPARPLCPEPEASSGVIHIELPGRATISVEHGADRALLQTILERLRK